jgi:hypothetical protein
MKTRRTMNTIIGRADCSDHVMETITGSTHVTITGPGAIEERMSHRTIGGRRPKSRRGAVNTSASMTNTIIPVMLKGSRFKEAERLLLLSMMEEEMANMDAVEKEKSRRKIIVLPLPSGNERTEVSPCHENLFFFSINLFFFSINRDSWIFSCRISPVELAQIDIKREILYLMGQVQVQSDAQEASVFLLFFSEQRFFDFDENGSFLSDELSRIREIHSPRLQTPFPI